MTKVSIIIPAFNEEEYIANCLIAIQNQDFEDYEVIVVDNGSTDKTKDVVSLFRKVRFVEQKAERGAGASKNYGADIANGQILLFIDADEVIGDGFIEQMIVPIMLREYAATIPYHLDNGDHTNHGEMGIRRNFTDGIFRAIDKESFKGFDTKRGYADDKVDYLDGQIKKIEVPLYHIVSKSITKSFIKGKWVGSSFQYNETDSKMAKLLYKLGYIVGFFKQKRK